MEKEGNFTIIPQNYWTRSEQFLAPRVTKKIQMSRIAIPVAARARMARTMFLLQPVKVTMCPSTSFGFVIWHTDDVLGSTRIFEHPSLSCLFYEGSKARLNLGYVLVWIVYMFVCNLTSVVFAIVQYHYGAPSVFGVQNGCEWISWFVEFCFRVWQSFSWF